MCGVTSTKTIVYAKRALIKQGIEARFKPDSILLGRDTWDKFEVTILGRDLPTHERDKGQGPESLYRLESEWLEAGSFVNIDIKNCDPDQRALVFRAIIFGDGEEDS
jgi:hypothetical protein